MMASNRPPLRILLVEDNRDIRDALSDVLEIEGYEVTAVSNGLEALDQLRSTKELPALVLLDLTMPVMDGFQFRSEQLADSRLAPLPVIVMSADHQVVNKSSQMQASMVLRKPVEIDSLLKAIREQLCA
jgi:CheY-like chemotaxis protein